MRIPGISQTVGAPRRQGVRAVMSVASLTVIAAAAWIALAGAHAAPPAGTASRPAGSAAPGSGGTEADEASRVVLKGEIVDLGCYLMHEGRGETHLACAQACVKGGAPVGLLSEGVLYVLFAPHDSAAPFDEAKRLVGRNATVTGVVHGRGGMRGLAVTMVAARS